MARKWNKALAFGLALCMCVGSMNVSAWATTEKVELPTKEGGASETIEVEVTVNENKIGAETPEEGVQSESSLNVKVNGEFEFVEGENNEKDLVNGELKYTAENSDGTYKAEGGYEVKTEEAAPGDDVEDVTVGLKPGKPTSGGANSESEPVVDGDADRTDGEWDYTETTTSSDRTVTAETTEGKYDENGKLIENSDETKVKDTTKYEAPVAPEKYDGKNYTDPYGNPNKGNYDPQSNGLGLHKGEPTAPNLAPQGQNSRPAEGGYDFFLSGMGEFTDAAAPVFKYIVYQRDENGNPIPDPENPGEYLINEKESHLISGGNNLDNPNNAGAYRTGMDFQPSQLTLKYKDGEYFYAYCADYLVPTDGGTEQDPGHWYKMENLEDSGHYSTEDAEKLRAIALNGYWGSEEGTGSLDSIKAMLTEYAKANPTVIVKDKNGTDTPYPLETLIDGLKEHEALAVTQAAIWAYSINRQDEKDGVDKVVVVGAQSAIKCYGSNSAWDEYKPANNQANLGLTAEQLKALGLDADALAAREAEALRSDARMKALFDCLMGLDGISSTAKDEQGNELVSTVINEKNWVDEDSFKLTVKDKAKETTEDGEVKDYAANLDDNANNDIYNADLSFKLKFEPTRDAKDLLVYITFGDQTIVKRLAGEDSDSQYEKITADNNGVYTISGLHFTENDDFTFDISLKGAQDLKEGVYLYTAADGIDKEGNIVPGRLASQTLVGLATGSRDFEISKSYTLEVNVEENSTVKTEHFWRNEETTEPEVPEKPEEPEEPNDDEDPIEPQDDDKDIPDEDVPLVDIPDEEIPLASVPQTGVNNTPWSLMVAAAGLALAAVLGKKNK